MLKNSWAEGGQNPKVTEFRKRPRIKGDLGEEIYGQSLKKKKRITVFAVGAAQGYVLNSVVVLYF